MSYKALYRTYRPQTFEDVAGQSHVTITLKNAIKENRIAHAYLFAGPRGTGKTTIAKILAKAINCTGDHPPCNECPNCKAITQGDHPDVIEIDAASNNGVNEVRDLIDKVKYAPINAKYKVYIIDEVHMMTPEAFNALLKTLEEPPAHIVFILATTEPHKILPTIISRCQRFDFKRVDEHDIISRLEYVLKEENVEPQNMIHIGDNYRSDYEIPKKHKINSVYFPKTTVIMFDRNSTNNLAQMLTTSMPFWRDNQTSMNFIGIRSMLAVVANKYFDNPYRIFNKESDFNIDPFLIGYYAVGMYMFSVANWLLRKTENKGYKNLVFMARDGYLPMEIYNILKKYYNNVPDAKYLRVSRKALISAMIINKMDLYKLTDVINIENHNPKYIIKYTKDSLKDYTDEEIKNIIEKAGIKYEEDIKTKQKFNKLVKVIINNLFDEDKNRLKIQKLKGFFTKYYEDKSATFDIGYSGRPELYLSLLCDKPIDTYFLNINQDEAIKYSKIAGYNLTTYFDAKPAVTGFAYESIISELAPSTIGYDLTGEEVKPILEKNNKTYQERYIIGVMQEAAKQFVKDMLAIFGEEFKNLYYQNYYISLPFMSYINSSRPIDMLMFNSIGFEDTVRNKEIKPITEDWLKERQYRNQRSMNALINIGHSSIVNNSYLDYNNVVDLENHSKFVRLLFYAIYDRPTFKRRMIEIFKNHKIALKVGKVGYSFVRGTKNVIYKGIHKRKGGN